MPVPSSKSLDECFLDNYRPMLTLSHPFPRKEFDVSTSADWFSAVGDQPCFLSLVGWDKDQRYVARYTMQSLDSQANRNLPGCIPIHMDTVSVPDTTWDDLDVCDDIHPCGKDALTLWTSSTLAVIKVHISPMPMERATAAGPPFESVALFDPREGTDQSPVGLPDDFDFSLCAATGRLCTTTLHANEILVSDFLLTN